MKDAAAMQAPDDSSVHSVVTWVLGLLATFAMALLKVLYGRWQIETTDNKAEIGELRKTLNLSMEAHKECERKHAETQVKLARLEERVSVFEKKMPNGH